MTFSPGMRSRNFRTYFLLENAKSQLTFPSGGQHEEACLKKKRGEQRLSSAVPAWNHPFRGKRRDFTESPQCG
jgi:hypothetical protein